MNLRVRMVDGRREMLSMRYEITEEVLHDVERSDAERRLVAVRFRDGFAAMVLVIVYAAMFEVLAA